MTKSEIFEQLFDFTSSDWPDDEELVGYALTRTGYMGDNGYYGIEYWDDIDYETEDPVKEGNILVNYTDGEQKDIQVSEDEYITELIKHLIKNNNQSLADKLINQKIT